MKKAIMMGDMVWMFLIPRYRLQMAADYRLTFGTVCV